MKLCSYILYDKQRYCKNYKYHNSKYCFQHYSENQNINYISAILFYLNLLVLSICVGLYLNNLNNATTKNSNLIGFYSLDTTHMTNNISMQTNDSSNTDLQIKSSILSNTESCDILYEFYNYISYYFQFPELQLHIDVFKYQLLSTMYQQNAYLWSNYL